MIKFIKKAVSALLASIMCIPTGILSIANATEMESNGEYTVNLTESEGGFMQFTDNCLISSTASQEGYQMVQIDENGELVEVENDGTIWAFKRGDQVEIELIPDEGYQVSSFMIKDMATEKVLAQKDTSDNFFQFVMPAKNVVINATFSDGSVSSIPIVDEDNSSKEDIEYQDITETGEISKAEVEEIITDVITENYIKSHLNEEYIIVGNDIQLANVMLVKNTMFDGQYVEDDDTIDSIMYSIQDGDENMEANLQKVLGQLPAYTMVYDLNAESDYYVTWANTMIKDTDYTVQDVAFTLADESATVVDGCIYDAETGLVYIPKTLYMDEDGTNIFMNLQVQFMQVLNKRSRDLNVESEVNVLSVDEDNETIELQSSTQSILTLETVVDVATGMNGDNLNVFVNGVLLPETMYTYDSENGKLTIYMSSASIVSVEVSEGEDTLSDKLIEFMTDEVKAVTAESMAVGKVVNVDSADKVPPLGWGITIDLPIKYINNSTNISKVHILGSGRIPEAIQMIQKIMGNSTLPTTIEKKGTYFDIQVDFSSYAGQYSDFMQQLGKIYLVCGHTKGKVDGIEYNYDNPLGNAGGAESFTDKVRISVVHRDVTTEADGSLSGYIILGFVTVETHNQTGMGYLKVSFGTEPPTEEEIHPRDPIKLVLYKISEQPGAELKNSATLGGAKFQVIYYNDVEYTSPQECINKGHGNNVWIFQTKQDDSWLPYFPGHSHVGFIDFIDANYLAPESPTQQTDTFGYTGTYWIREIQSSDGFLLDGQMMDHYSGTGSNDVSNLGVVYYIDSSGDTPIVKCNGQPIQNGSGVLEVGALPTDALIVAEKPDIPYIETQSSVEDTGSQYGDATSHNVTCIDDVHISNLREQTLYTLETYLVDISTGAKIAGTDATTIIDTRTYTEKNWHGKIRINIDPVSLGLADHTLMFVNKLYDPEQGEPIAVSDDLGMVNEYVYFPNSGTLALDRETGKHITYTGHNTNSIDDPINFAQGTERATVIDEIWYKNLQPGKQYRIEAWMVDTDTGSPADDGNGSPIVVSSETKHFTPEEADGTVNITFSFDVNQSIAGRKYVIFSEIYLNDELVSSHRDINDEKEMIWLPKITTKLTDNETGTDITYAKGTVRLNDQVDYSRMKPGETYMVKGTLYNMNTKEVLLDDNGNEVTTTQTFTPTSEYGSWDISYEFPADTLAGTVSVSYVEVYVKDNDGNWVIVAEHKDFWDENQRNYMPYIDTTALDQKTAHHISYAEKTMKLYDTVHYEALHPEYTYKLVSELRDVATGEIVTDDAGVQQVVTSYFKADFDMLDNQFLTYGDIIPENHEGSGITFDVDAEYFAGRTLVVYERLYFENEYSEEYLIAEHQELLDEEQTIHVPKIWTSAIDSDTFTKTSFADNSTTIIDTVSYENLIPDLTYELKGYIIDKNQSVQTGTNVVATGTNGKLAENSLVFTPEKSSGAVKLSFEIDTSKFGTEDYNGMVFVVYEELYVVDRYDDADHRCLVATHTDIADVNQTVYVPRITTSLNDGKSGSKILLAEKNAHLTDTVDYYRFQPSTDYTIKGKLIDMETGDVLIDSKGNRVEKTVTVTSSATGTGSWTVDYDFDATELQGRVIVAYADVYVRNGERNDILSPVASHTDFWDEEQRVYIPVISTVATDQKTNSHITYAEENVWITDRIYYSFLKPGTEYKLISKLVDKETGEVVVDDKGITQQIESTFTTTPNESQERYNQIISNPFTDSSDTGIGYSYGYVIPADGTTLPDGSDYHGVVFTLDAHTFEGRTLVIYEELQVKVNNEYYTIASHMDRNDENQTVHIPKIRTNAVDSETMTHTSKMDGQMTVIDTVSYENLIPGFTYILEGYLMDKPRDDTKGYGKIKDKDGNYITNTIEFTPDKPNGTVKLSLSGNASEFQTDEGAFSSETLVVFERLYLKDNKDASDEWLIVANHENINDENQTIYCPRISTKVVSYDLGEEAKEGEADHVLGAATYQCDYCKINFYGEFDVKRHIEQTALCRNMKGTYSVVTEATIYDRVYYENLIPNRTYTIVGHLIDTKTGKSVLINQRAVQSEEKYFTPGTANGEVDVVFHVTGLDLAGGRYVVYEELFLDGVSIAEHKDKFDRNQTFYVPKMATSVRDVDTGKNITKADTKSTIIDTIEMSGLKEGENYYIRSSLIDSTIQPSGAKSTNYGDYYIDGTGNIVNAKAWRKKGDTVWHSMDECFQIDQTLSDENYVGTATIEVQFEVDVRTTNGGKSFEGTSYTVFQELYLENGTLVGQHKDINDSQQTIYIGELHTVALDKDSGTHLMEGTTGKTMVDTVYYSNLEHKTYYVIPTVYVKETEEEVTPVNASSLYTAQYVANETGFGEWKVSISLPDLTPYQGKTLVVLEEIRDMDGNVVASEKNLLNESQSVHIPKVSTSEADDVNGTHYTLSEGKWVCDNYDCKEEFTEKAEAEKHIAPVYQCDNCGVQFSNREDAEAHVSGNCKDATVFRDSHQLVRDEEGNVVIDDWFECSGCGARFKTNQECLNHINGSDVCYTYTDINAKHNSYSRVNASITDTVSYVNLIPGQEYAVVGSIINIDTNMPATDIDGEEIVAHTSFVPMSSKGTVKVHFDFDGTALEGDRYAVFEQLQLIPKNANGEKAEGITIARHEDLTDKNQIFYVPSVSTSAIDKWSQTNVTKANSITTLVDTVTYYGLNSGNTADKYIIEGVVMDAETMQPLVLANGDTATARTPEFTSRGNAEEQKQLEFTFSTSALEGKTLVVFEKLYLVKDSGNVLIGQHTEIMDEQQTTHIPMIRTFAYNAENGEQVAGADDSVTLIDKVVCTNLVPGKRYKLEAKLVNPVNGQIMKDADGHDITGTLDMYENNYNEFTVSNSGRTVRTVKFVFDGSNLAGQTAVIHETLYMEGTKGSFNVVAQHCPLPNVNNSSADLDYRNQRIDFPAIETTVKDSITKTEFVKNSENAKIIDTVSYSNLTGGLEYKLVGTIYDLKHQTLLTDSFNNTFTSTKYFVADNSGSGTVDMEFTFNTKDMIGNDFVVFEELFLNDASIATHKDVNDVKQTFKVPQIHTSVIAEDIPQRMTMADNDAVIIDTVTYENLIPDKEYTVKGILMDKNTGKPLLDLHEEEITGETIFKPTTANGTVEVQFRFDATNMKGVVAVAYEELFYTGASIAEHKDINDEEQTIYFPEISTLAKVNETSFTHVGPADSIMTITDTVTYKNLIGDESYHVQGWLIDVETGKPAIDANGDEVHAEATFQTAHPDPDVDSKAVSGTVDLVFQFDATGMRGKTLVVYENVYYHKNPNVYLDYQVAEHNDIADEKQRVHIPEIETTAWDSETRNHITKADNNATIIDTVSYKNLYPGLEYTLEAYMIDLDEGGEVAVDDYGLPITATTTFIPKDWSGTVDVRFSDFEISKLAGHTLVAYEYLYYKDVLIEHHDNPEDEAQTIHLPRITTNATNFESDSSNAMAQAYVNVIDEIEFFNLVPELEYTAVGLIINKATGQPARDAEGKYIKGTTTFTPDVADGTVDVVFTFNAEGMEDTELVVFEEIFYQGNLYERKSVAEHSDMMDENQSVSVPKITTNVSDDKTSLKLALASDDMSITDTVRYKGLTPNTEYELVGKLYDKETGKPALDDNGVEIVASKNFSVTEKQGYEEVTFTFSGKTLEGHTLVATEELYVVGDGGQLSMVATHTDLNDVDQTLYIPKARTIVKDNETAVNYSKIGNSVSITDTVKYENLVSGYSYTVVGTLVDRDTKETIMDVNGNAITAETSFIVKEPDGEIDVKFTFDATGFDGMTYNVFETITCNGKVVAEHKDVADESQNIHFPKITTEAYDANSELQLTLAEDNATIIDIVYYENLNPGTEYTVTGKLIDKTTGIPILDPSKNVNPDEMLDNIIEHWVCDGCGELYDSQSEAMSHVDESSTDNCETFTLVLSYDIDDYNALIESATLKTVETFIPEESTGHIQMTYEISTNDLAGHTIVAYATLSLNDVVLAEHDDINDEAETIYIPEINTTATDAESGLHVSRADSEMVIVDRVEYKNLVKDMNYVMMGYLMDKADGEVVMDANGEPVYAETEFQPTESDGYVTVTFRFNGSHLGGRSLVAYEYLAAKYKDEPIIAKHEDIEDEEQTIDIPKIETKAFDALTNENIVKAGETTTVIDRVYYHNLEINQIYTINGILIDKETGTAVLDADGNEVRTEKTFTARDHDGYVDVEFVFNAKGYSGKTLVAYEELFLKGYSIATHDDINDENQTVYLPKITTMALDKKTNTHMAYADDTITIVDTVTYTNVAPNAEYTLVGTLMDGETGDKLTESVEKTFTSDSNSGVQTVEFTVDATDLKGKKVVVYEELKTKFVINRKDVETYICNQCGRVYDKKEHAVWHFEDSATCFDYSVKFETEYEYGENVTIAEHKDLNDVEQTVYIPEIYTTATDKITGEHLTYAGDKVTIVDEVHYSGLQANVEYEVVGTLMNKDTQKPITVDGKDVTATSKFTPNTNSGTVDVEFIFNGEGLEGLSLVAYEKLFINGMLIADHEDITDEAQTVYVPKISTNAVDGNTNEHLGATGTTTIVDTVEYHNLIPGLQYTVKGILMNKDTGKAYTTVSTSADDSVIDAMVGMVTGGNKTEYTAEKTFTPSTKDGTIEMTFDVVISEKANIVVFEEIYLNDVLIAEHKDINDANQTVQYPEIQTNATSKVTGSHTVPVEKESIIIDEVTYQNLIVGKEYTINGTLMDKETGNSTGYTASKTFTAEEPNGSVKLEFTVDTTQLAGKSVVAFETLVYNEKVLATHKDLTDKDQTVNIPKIATHASDKLTQTQVVSHGKEVVIVDIVTYNNLTVGNEYTMKGTLMLKGKDGVESTGITAEKIFTPTEKDGRVELEFKVDTTKYAGASLVAYEKLFEKDVEITIHENPDDKDQTVYVPQISTRASVEKDDKNIKSTQTKIVDVVTYHNLVPGISYSVKGTLMDKTTGKELLGVDGKSITVSKTFIPENADGEVIMEFVFDTSILDGKAAVVVFEDMILNDVVVAIHHDIEDENQTVKFDTAKPNIKTIAKFSDGNKEAKPNKETIIVDTVIYENLEVGTEYVLSGKLVSKKSGKAIAVNGKAVESTITFTPEKSNGSVEMKFTLNSSSIKEEYQIVVFEKLSLKKDNSLVAEHEDLTDADQTVVITPVPDNPENPDEPYIRTTAKFSDGNKESKPNKETVIVDTVTYRNLKIGTKYVLSGKLVSKKTGKTIAVNGKAVESKVEFTPTTTSGSVDVIFTFNSSSISSEYEIVVYERLELENGTLVAKHEDLSDANQTVKITPTPTVEEKPKTPYIKTTAKFDNGNKTAKPSTSTTIIDTVVYENLQVGKEYVLSGKLVSKKTGKTIAVNGKAIENKITFTPSTTSGSVEMKFTFDSSSITTEYEIVVFERLEFPDGELVAEHEDLSDSNQTVKIVPNVTPNTPTTPNTPSTPEPEKVKTGDEYTIIISMFIGTIVLLGVAILILRKKNN